MYKSYETSFKNQTPTLREKIQNLSFSYIMFIILLASIGVTMLYSAANGNWSPWALNQLMRFGLGFVVMITFALTDIRVFMRYAYIFICNADFADYCGGYRAYRYGRSTMD